ncbi:MAG: tRNA lysidine(34) synthetase TilS [Bacteroidetes bacterium]|nr:tRNA lysidine(34) synthetase TilS [Bacteroidota bacterium]MDA0903431.1 tRNA lysidine(34) synthetase TilS [Bacteroidota bacterium]MDA1241537.1 tRNA lysidine(34) synthetase TilS [Bacteroidota bacterium]
MTSQRPLTRSLATRSVELFLTEARLNRRDRVVVAASGGCDSMCLLHLLEALEWPLVVAHVNHGLRQQESEADESWVRAWSERRGLTCEVLRLDASHFQGSQGLQGEARKKRYAWLEEIQQKHQAKAVLTGHHADDQVETLLIHLLRSGDPLAIHGMDAWMGQVGRPLLTHWRSELEALATLEGWVWREDASNASRAYLRNRLRHDLIPLLEDLFPGAKHQLNLMATRGNNLRHALLPLLGEAQQLAQKTEHSWDVNVLQHNVWAQESFLRYLVSCGWSRALGEEALGLLHSQPGRRVQGKGRNPDRTHPHHASSPPAWLEVLRERDQLWIQPCETPKDTNTVVDLGSTHGLVTNSSGTLTWKQDVHGEFRAPTALNADDEPTQARDLEPREHPSTSKHHQLWIPASFLPVEWRQWRPGDRIQPLGMTGNSLVSDVLTQAKIPNARRPSVKVLTRMNDDCILWVPGCKISEEARLPMPDIASADEPSNPVGWLFQFIPHP